jgi:hypothetical protein
LIVSFVKGAFCLFESKPRKELKGQQVGLESFTNIATELNIVFRCRSSAALAADAIMLVVIVIILPPQLGHFCDV